MNEEDNSLALLPNGFADLLPPFAEGEAMAIRILMDKFSSFGYRRIKPPLLEFEDSLLGARIGALLANDTFRLMDPVSHRMLGLRSDITAQISRIVSSRLKSEPRPLRLAYASDVLRTKVSQMRSERQFMQVGCELIGNIQSCDSDVEICVMAVLGLKSLGIKDITLDLTIPDFVSHLLNDIDDDIGVDDIVKAVSQRDMDALIALGNPSAELIAKAMSASGAASCAISGLENIGVDDYLRGRIAYLSNICAGIKNAMADLGIDDVSLTIDVLENTGFEYHKNMGFTLFSSGVSGELGRGGRYDIYGEAARGFTIYMDMVSPLCDDFVEKDTVFISNKEPWNVISDLQNEGWVVVRGVSPNNGCRHIYEDGRVKEIS